MLQKKIEQWERDCFESLPDVNLEHFTVRYYNDQKIDDYCKRMSKDNSNIIVDWSAVKYLEEQGFSDDLDHISIEPRSIYTVSKLYKALEKFSNGRIKDVNVGSDIQSGIDLAWKVFSRPKDIERMKPLDITIEMVNMITTNKTASAGLTDYLSKKKDVMDFALFRSMKVLSGKSSPKPCLAFSRTQKGKKTRLVWGYPYEMTIIEGMFARQLYDNFKVQDTPMAFGKTSLILGTKIKTSSNRKIYTYSVDMSSYDSSISNNLIEVAFNILKTWFKFDKNSIRAWDIVKKYFICTPIVMPDHKVYYGKRHGVPSGSYFTQLIDSIVNVIICGALSHHFNMFVSDRDIMVLGDDLIFFSDTKVSLESLSRYATKILGVEFNVEKSQFVDNKYTNRKGTIHYLGRNWFNVIPDIPFHEILEKMVFPERYRCYSSKADIREQEVKNIVASYCFTYNSAWKILKLQDKPYYVPAYWLEYDLLYRKKLEFDHRKLSGLTSFYIKEGIIEKDRGTRSLFNLFWL